MTIKVKCWLGWLKIVLKCFYMHVSFALLTVIICAKLVPCSRFRIYNLLAELLLDRLHVQHPAWEHVKRFLL
jgi:hypothetical protein